MEDRRCKGKLICNLLSIVSRMSIACMHFVEKCGSRDLRRIYTDSSGAFCFTFCWDDSLWVG